MKRKMKIIVFLLGFVLISIASMSQTIVYQYDDSGNRIARKLDIHYLKNIEAHSHKIVTNNISEESIVIHPNPTQGKLSVEFKNVDLDLKPQLKVFAANGSLIYNNYSTSLFNEIDISDQNDGVYLLYLVIGDNKGIWKIIKH